MGLFYFETLIVIERVFIRININIVKAGKETLKTKIDNFSRFANSIFGRYLIFIIVFISIFFLYGKLSREWAIYGGACKNGYLLEYPLLIFIGRFFYFPILNNFRTNILAALVAALPIITVYAVIDVFYFYLHQLPRISDIKNVMILWDIYPLLFAALIFVVSMSFIPMIVLVFKGLRTIEKHLFIKRIIIGSALRIFLTIILVVLLSTNTLYAYQSKFLSFQVWSLAKNIKTNGRLATAIYYGRKNQETTERLAIQQHKHFPNHLSVEIKNKKNIHIVMLESFMDPRLIKDISFNKSPLYEKMPNILNDNYFTMAVSPVYGGATAQSEFEILCGVPAFAKIDSIEFNVFKGHEVNSLVTALKRFGYTAIASIGSKEGFYNSYLAYKSIGFNEIHFNEMGGDIHKKKGSILKLIFDGDLLDQNIDYIHAKFISKGRPVINYVLGVYGHCPYDSDRILHPNIIKSRINNKYDYNIEKISNLFYYRSKAVYDYIVKLRKIDPTAIVLIISDHLPPVLSKDIRYAGSEHDNIFILFDGATQYKAAKYLHYYELPYAMVSMLSGKSVTPPNATEYEDLYFDILSTGHRPK